MERWLLPALVLLILGGTLLRFLCSPATGSSYVYHWEPCPSGGGGVIQIEAGEAWLRHAEDIPVTQVRDTPF
jgi:hypothetical protein